jgi:hypothetical protein
MPTSRTLGELIQFAADPFFKLCHHDLSWDVFAEYEIFGGLSQFGIPGVEKLEAVANATWGEPLTLANLRRIRGLLTTEHRIGPDDAEAMTLAEVAEVFSGERSTEKRIDQFAELRRLADELTKGDQHAVVTLFCDHADHRGSVSLEDFATRLLKPGKKPLGTSGKFPPALAKWYDIQWELNAKFEKHLWHFYTRGGMPSVKKITREELKALQRDRKKRRRE